MRNLLILFPLVTMLSACSHTINLRANHLAAPVVGEKQWSGHVAGVGTGSTKVTMVQDYHSNPPIRTGVEINKDVDVGDVLLINNISVDASLSLIESLELYMAGSVWGLRWQFLNHGETGQSWVAALQGGAGSKTESMTNSDNTGTVTAEAKSKVEILQGGLSLGYKFSNFVPYVSYIYENYKVSTTVMNNNTNFGPFEDKGIHNYYSIGLSTHGKGFRGAIEYSMITVNWEGADKAFQTAAGGKIGYSW